MTEKQRMTNNEPGDEYGENSKSSGSDKGYSKTTRNAYGEPSPVHLGWENLIARNTVDGEESIKVFYILLRSYLHEFYPQIGCDT